MSEQHLTQDQLDKEMEAVVLQLKRAQRKNWLKFGAVMLLSFILVGFVVYVSLAIPAAVMSIMGQ